MRIELSTSGRQSWPTGPVKIAATQPFKNVVRPAVHKATLYLYVSTPGGEHVEPVDVECKISNAASGNPHPSVDFDPAQFAANFPPGMTPVGVEVEFSLVSG